MFSRGPGFDAQLVECWTAAARQAQLSNVVVAKDENSEIFFKPEFKGSVNYKGQNSVDAHYSHSQRLVVDALASLVGQRMLVGNDRSRDLFCVKAGRMIGLFEVKTGVSTSEVYACVGQL